MTSRPTGTLTEPGDSCQDARLEVVVDSSADARLGSAGAGAGWNEQWTPRTGHRQRNQFDQRVGPGGKTLPSTVAQNRRKPCQQRGSNSVATAKFPGTGHTRCPA